MNSFPDLPIDDSGKLVVENNSGIDLPVKNPTLLRLLEKVEAGENVTFRHIELIYVGEKEIVEVNRQHLDKDYVTDTISFRYDEEDDQAIEGTLFECAPRIEEQSREFNTSAEAEFYRVFVHGLLHLAGYEDDSEENKKTMTALENHYLETLDIPL